VEDIMFGKAIRAALASLFFATAAHAGAGAGEVETRVRHVRASDLDLRSPVDRKVLDRRVGWAVMDVCPQPASPELAELMARAACRRKALRATREQVAALVTKAGDRRGTAVLAQADVR
jgi:UrcA family protein